MSEPIKDATRVVRMYCVKCREHVMVTSPQSQMLSSNRPALRGNCPHCQTVTFSIVKKSA